MRPSSDKSVIDLRMIQKLPKAELHCHLDGSMRKSTLFELAADDKIALPADLSFGHGFGSLESYLSIFDFTCSVMQSAENLERISYELIEDAYADGIWHLEMRFSPLLLTKKGLSFRDQIAAVKAGIKRAQKNWDMSAGIIICGLRHYAAEQNVKMAKIAAESRDLGVVAYDLAGPEHGFLASAQIGSFKEAQKHCLNITCHAAETEDPATIREAIFMCGAQRIGHGTQLFKDEELFNYIIDHQIPIESCISSNHHTGAVDDLSNHPARDYLRAGALLTLNTDNRLVSQTTLSDEYLIAHQKMGLSYEELIKIARNGFVAAFLPWKEKEEVLKKFDEEVLSYSELKTTSSPR